MAHGSIHLERSSRSAGLSAGAGTAVLQTTKVDGTRRCTQGCGRHRRGVAAMVGKQAARAVYGARNPRCHGLVDGDRTGVALMGVSSWARWRVLVGLFSLSFLISAHVLVLLDGAVSLVHLAIAVVRRTTTAAVEALVVHALQLACFAPGQQRFSSISPNLVGPKPILPRDFRCSWRCSPGYLAAGCSKRVGKCFPRSRNRTG